MKASSPLPSVSQWFVRKNLIHKSTLWVIAVATVFAMGFAFAETVRAQSDTRVKPGATSATDIHFHKFVPKVTPEQAQALNAISDSPNDVMTQQITLLLQEKNARTPAQQKIDSNVLYTIRMLQGRAPAPGIASLETGIDLDDDNNVVVDITGNVTEQLLQQLKAAGAVVLNSQPKYHAIRAIVPPSQMENLAASPDVKFIGRKAEMITSGNGRLGGAAKPSTKPAADRAARREVLAKRVAAVVNGGSVTIPTGQGSVDTEGDITHRAFDARAAFGLTGAGLKIGVLSDSVNAVGGLTHSQALGDMPPTCGTPVVTPCVTVLQDTTGGGVEDEGDAMLEIIHDMVPGANLYFATADISEAQFAANILALRAAGCDIIVDDVAYFDEPPFQDGIVAQSVASVVADGALYFSSAGNEGNVDANSAGYFEGDYNDTGSPAFAPPVKTGTVHNFTPGAPLLGDVITVRGGRYTLNWADPQGASSNDYDLFVVASTGTIRASSTNIQDGTQNPFEQIVPPALTAGQMLVVFKTAGAQSVFFAVNTFRGQLATSTPGQTHGHSAVDAEGMYSVAAAPAAGPLNATSPTGPFPNPFTAANQPEVFTSDGPRKIFFDVDGTPVTPGDFSSTGGTVRNKPDITGADGVTTTLPQGGGLNPFYGTSAGAPSAASVAALVKSAKPSITQTEMRAVLTGTAIDIGAGGYDRDTGFGIVMAWEAVKSLGVPGAPAPELGTIVASENPGNGNGIIEAGEGASLVIPLKNTAGVLDATGVTATLATTTPGVTITQPTTAAYADIPVGSAGGNNLSPFTFTLASDSPCALAIDFTLTVHYNGGLQSVLPFHLQTGLVTLTNGLGTLPATFPGVTTATGAQTNRVTRNGTVSTCAAAKAFPGVTTTAGTRTFDSYTFTAAQATCLSSVLNSSNNVNMFEVIYSPSFDLTNVASNYAADAGASTTPQNVGVTTTAGTNYTIVVSDVPGTAAGTNYTLQIPACVLNANVNHLPVAVAQDVTVTATTPHGTAAANIDNGSSDPDGDTLTITQSPAGPYPVGITSVLLTVVDTKGATAQATANVTVNDQPADLTIAGTHAGNFTQEQTGAIYTLTVTNSGGLATSGTVTVVDTLPTGLTATAISGTNWTCTLGTLTCTRSSALNGGSSYEPILVTVNVAGNAAATVTNNVAVSGGGETNTANNSSADVTNVTPIDFTISGPPNQVNVTAGQSATFTITVTPGAGGFPNSISFAQSGAPSLTTVTFTPPTLTPGAAPATTTMTVATTAASAGPWMIRPMTPRGPVRPVWFVVIASWMVAVFAIGLVLRTRKRVRTLVPIGAVALLFGAIMFASGCSGNHSSSNPGTQKGVASITVTATSGGLTHTTTVMLNVQ